MNADIVDYALPLIKLGALLRQIHDLCLDKNYDQAMTLCNHVAVEARILSSSLKIMGEAQ